MNATIYLRHPSDEAGSHTAQYPPTRELNWLGRRVAWFQDAPAKGKIYRIIAPILVTVALLFLSFSIVGIPLALAFVREFAIQECHAKHKKQLLQNKKNCGAAQKAQYLEGRLAPFSNDNTFGNLEKIRPNILHYLEKRDSESTTLELFRQLVVKDSDCLAKLGLVITPA